MIPCPRCAAAVQPDWDWCHACGYDPEGLRPRGSPAGPSAATGPLPRPPGPPRPSSLAPAPAYAPPPYAGPAGAGAVHGAPRRRSGAATAIKVVLIIAAACVALIVVLVAAVSLLGTTPKNEVGTVRPAVNPPVGEVAVAWTTWTAPDGSFHLDFPISPASQPMKMDDPKFGGGAMVIADLGSSGYMMTYFEPSAAYEVTDPPAVLEGAIDGMVASMGMTLDSRTPGTFGYLPSIDFSGRATDDGQSFDVRGTVFTSARRTFVLMTLSEPGVPSEHDRFLQSFVAG